MCFVPEVCELFLGRAPAVRAFRHGQISNPIFMSSGGSVFGTLVASVPAGGFTCGYERAPEQNQTRRDPWI